MTLPTIVVIKGNANFAIRIHIKRARCYGNVPALVIARRSSGRRERFAIVGNDVLLFISNSGNGTPTVGRGPQGTRSFLESRVPRTGQPSIPAANMKLRVPGVGPR